MSTSLRLGVLLTGLVLVMVIFWILKKGRIPTKFALVWLIPTSIILLVAIWPQILIFIANAMGFQTMSNFTIGFLIVMLLFLIMSLTIIISGQQTKITLLIQELSILEKKVDDLIEKENNK